MAGTLTISTLSDGTNSTSATNCISGSAKAWVNFVGSTASIRAQYNVSSVTRNSTGNYTANFTNALTDANYSLAGSGVVSTALCFISGTSSSVTFSTNGTSSGGAVDSSTTSIAIFR